MMSSTIGAVKEAYTTFTGETAKAADLAKDTVDLANPPRKGITTDHGVYISDTDNWLKVTDGDGTGPALLEDQIAREKIMRFDHERIPERVVHARGAGAHGYFKVFDNRASKYTFAPVLTDPSRITPTFVRFSTVQSSRGGADTVRDVRGFATKLYTEEGNWDIVGNNIPVFFIQDAIKFPDVIHAVKPEPQNEVPQGQSAHNNFWDFVGLTPETAHMVNWIMSDRAIPRSFRMMQGFGVNAFTLVNAQGKRCFVKFHWIPELGVHSLLWDEALKINGQDPDFHRKDLEEAITTGVYPKWLFGIQVISEENENDFEFDILDATKLWPEDLVPVEIVGEMVLNRTVDEFFSEVEQVAFCTANVVPGISFSDDPLLQGRNFSYFDTQITRLGVNWQEIPINRPVCPVLNHHRDGQKRHKITKGVNYWPNRFEHTGPVPPKEGGYAEYPQKIAGIKQRMRGAKFQEHFKQAQMFLNSLSEIERVHLVSAYSFELSHCDDPTVYESYTKLLQSVDFGLAKRVAMNVGGVVPEKATHTNPGHKAIRISQFEFAPKEPTIKSRRVAILVADGFNLDEVVAIRTLLKAGSATTWVVGPRRGPVYPAGEEVGKGTGYHADHHWEGQRSTLFDALVIPGGAKHAQALADSGRCVHWVREAFGHCKIIGALGEGVVFLREVVRLPSVQVAADLNSDNITCSYGVVTAGQYDLGSAAADTFTIKQGGKDFVSNFAYELSQHRCFQRELDGLTAKVSY